MGQNSPSTNDGDNSNANSDGTGLYPIRGRFPFKRNPKPASIPLSKSSAAVSLSDRRRSHVHGGRSVVPRKLCSVRGTSLFYLCILIAVFAFALASMVLQSSIASMVFRQGGGERIGRTVREGLKFGSSLKFISSRIDRSFELERARDKPRVGVRSPRLAIILGNMEDDPLALMLLTVMKNLQGLGYVLQIYATEDGKTKSLWEKTVGQVSVLSPENYGHIDWSIFDGIVVNSLEAHDAISSLMQEPFCSVQLIWIIQEDTLSNRLPLYQQTGQQHLITYWKKVFRRPDVVVFPDYSFPMLYSMLDAGNFFVIPGSPIDVWAAERYLKIHSKSESRLKNGYNEDDILVLVVGSSFFYNELSWDYAVAMHNLGPLLINYAKEGNVGPSFKFLFICGNSSNAYNDALQEIAGHLGLNRDSVGHYGLDADVDEILLISDIVLYGSSQEEQGFPSLLTRAMTFGIPIIAPDYPIIKKYVTDGENGIIYSKDKPEELMKAFMLLISKGKLSNFATTIAASGRFLAKNMQASEYVYGYTKLLNSVLTLPSDSMLPQPVSKLKGEWEWDLFSEELDDMAFLLKKDTRNETVVYKIEEDMTLVTDSRTSQNEPEMMAEDIPTELDWIILGEIDSSEEVERVELEEIEGRTDKSYGIWDELYRDAKKAEKLKSEANERDEGELERTGQPLCIYEIYNGAGAWPFLHHGSLYRGLSLSTRSRRLRSDDVDAVGRLSILNESYYRDILLEMGGMFSIANKVDNVHKRPWIGFQSWRASARKVSLSSKAERVLEGTVQQRHKGDVVYFWAHVDMDGELAGNDHILTFWSMCDILNGGNCRRMYGLPPYVDVLPPMPEDGGYWSSVHSWVMPTPSFLEFMMFSRMFADSLDSLHVNSTTATECLLGSSLSEKKHCYCRILELLVNVWAYHSARTMVYIDPNSGSLEEQHPVEDRKGLMWTKYFNATLLKTMDEDLAEAADDGDHPYEPWLWPRTGEVHWQVTMTSTGNCNYSCATATETLEWIHAIIDHMNPYSFFWESHVVNFLTHRLWEAVDKEWLDCLRDEPVEHLIQIPSGFFQDHWPSSLKKYITTSSNLAFSREQADLKKLFPNMQVALLNDVIAQGMNPKKRHEIEALAAVVSSVSRDVETNTVIDVGAGQGYLAQVLSFEYQLSVIAIDASSHHGRITQARTQRIMKHYDAKMRKSSLRGRGVTMPKTVTCRVLSPNMLKALLNSQDTKQPLLLTGLHACGDLSVTMLRTFMESEQVKAIVSIGCCYNLLSEEEGDDALRGFPISKGVKSTGLHLTRSARDLACQSADKWRGLGKDDSLHNFELHAFRAAFQMVLSKYFPETLTTSPTIGRQGKALRRPKQQSLTPLLENDTRGIDNGDDETTSRQDLFEKFSQSGMRRLNLNNKNIDFAGIWKEAQPFVEVVGAYWSLRATLGPVLETLILLDRLLFLQEQGMEAVMIPIFNPTISPRNIALIATKNKML
ncbi:hypothetical protein LXL04_022103 [Taraxacum kok-saghyz]